MSAADTQELIGLIEAQFARSEVRLTTMVNERNTHVIDATTAIVGALHDEIKATTEAVDSLSANMAERVSALEDNITARRAYLDERIALAESRITTLADLIPGGAEALNEPPLREAVAALAAVVAHLERRPLPLWAQALIAAFVLIEVVQTIVIAVIISRLA